MFLDYNTSDDDSNSGSDKAADPLPQTVPKFPVVPRSTVREFPVKRLVIDHRPRPRSSRPPSAPEPDVTPPSPPPTRAYNPGNRISVGDSDYMWSMFDACPYPSNARVTEMADTRGLTSADVNVSTALIIKINNNTRGLILNKY